MSSSSVAAESVPSSSVALEAAGHTVAVVDRSKSSFRRLPERWTGRTVLGHAFDRDTLEHAGIKEAEAFAAVTNGDNTNIVSARIAREHYGVNHVVARIYDPRRAIVYQRLGIPTVATVSWSTDQVMRRLFPEQRSDRLDGPDGLREPRRGQPAVSVGGQASREARG